MSALPDDCETLRFALLQRADEASSDLDAVAARGDLAAHLAGCSACRRELARAVQRVQLVRSLPRALAPAELGGAVVAALQAGVRQERAVQAVASLTPVAAPDDLARRITVPHAPAVLERLVGEDLADPAKALASRYARRLERLRAPDDLERRLGRAPRPHASRLMPIALAVAGLLLTAGALAVAYTLRRPERALPSASGGPTLVVQHVEVRDLGPVSGLLLSGVTSGLLDAERLKREDL